MDSMPTLPRRQLWRLLDLLFKIDDFCGAKPKSEKDREAFAQIVHEKAFDLCRNYGPEKKLRDALLVMSKMTLELLHDYLC